MDSNEIKEKRVGLTCEVSPTHVSGYWRFLKATKRTDISHALRSKIISRVNEKALDKLYTGSYNVRVPGFGIFALKKKKNVVDPVMSKKNGTAVNFRNAHSEGWTFYVKFYHHEGTIPNLRFYTFRLTRTHKRNFKKVILNELPQL